MTQHLDDVIDLEAYAAASRPVPANATYRIRIDKQHYTVSVSNMTGREILALAGKTPEKSLLRQKVKGAVSEVEPDQRVSFLTPGVERFMTIPREVQEGEAFTPRVQFPLLPNDAAFLNSLGLRWEAVKETDVRAIVIYDWALPAGYNVAGTDMHIRLTVGYPDAQIDMAYFAPALKRADGRSINGLSAVQFDGRQWQQWSRHRTANSPWRLGEDDISTHIAYVREWLSSELQK